MTSNNNKVDTDSAEAPDKGVGCGALVSHARPQTMDEWFLSLPAGRQAVLREDKWMLAQAAFIAGAQAAADEKSKDTQRMDWMADSYGAAGMTQAEAEREARAYEKAYAEAKRRGMKDRVAVRAAVDVALALANTVVTNFGAQKTNQHEQH